MNKYILLALLALFTLSMSRVPQEEVAPGKETQLKKKEVKKLSQVKPAPTITSQVEPTPTIPEITPGKVIEQKEDGEIDWGTGMLIAIGKAAIDKENKNEAQARLMAERAAVVVAQRNLLELIKGVRVSSETVVENMMLESDVIISRVDGVVKNAKPIGKPKYDGDIVEVKLQTSLYEQDGIAGAIRSVMGGTPTMGGAEITDEAKEFMELYSSIVLDTRGIDFEPSLFPKIYDRDGNLVFDPQKYYNPDNPYMRRAFYYLKRLEEIANLPELKENPYIIKALETLHGDIVISDKDAKKVGWLRKAFGGLVKAGKFILTLL